MSPRTVAGGRLQLGLLVGALGAIAPLLAQPDERFGAMGDSLTDEYFEESYDYARNWTVLLVDQRGLTMGPTAEEAGQPGGTWGEPRRTGYEDDWARSGATTDSAISGGQHTGLADGATTRAVTRAVVFIGTNDFAPGLGAWDPIYFGDWGQEEIEAWIASRIVNLEIILDTLLPTGVEVVLANVSDFSPSPVVQFLYPDPVARDRVAAAVEQFGEAIRGVADAEDLVFDDIFGLAHAIFGTNSEPREILLVGNVEIDLDAIDTPTGAIPTAAWVHDGVHPNTVIQGVLGNVFLTGLNHDGAGVALFSEEELLAHAGVAYGGIDTLEAQIGSFEDYVVDFALIFADGFESGDTSAWSTTVGG